MTNALSAIAKRKSLFLDFPELTSDKIFAKSYWNSFPILKHDKNQDFRLTKSSTYFGRQYLLKSQSRLQIHSTWTATTPPNMNQNSKKYIWI